jgi:MFS family permease
MSSLWCYDRRREETRGLNQMPSRQMSREFSPVQHSVFALLWFAYNLQWGALIPVVIPAQVPAIVGPAHKELVTDAALGAGSFVALVTTPLAGLLSDRSQNPRGRRRGFLFWGVVLNVISLAALAAAAPKSSIWVLVASLLVTQFACNWWVDPRSEKWRTLCASSIQLGVRGNVVADSEE